MSGTRSQVRLAAMLAAGAACLVAGTADASHTVDFTCDPACTAKPGATLTFAAVTDAAKPLYAWDLDGNGKFDDETTATATRTFGAAGDYMIGLRVTESADPADAPEKVRKITIEPAAPDPPAPPPKTPARSGFDDIAIGTKVTDQIPGIVFPTGPFVFRPTHVSTASPPNALQAPIACATTIKPCSKDAYILPMQFPQPVDCISLRAGFDDSSLPPWMLRAQLVAYDATGKLAATSAAVRLLTVGFADQGFGPIRTPVVACVEPDAPPMAGALVTIAQQPGVPDWSARVQIDDVVIHHRNDPAPAPPSVRITSPADSSFFDRLDTARLSGTVSTPGGIGRFCITTDVLEAIPDDCAATGPSSIGSFGPVAIPGLHYGRNWVTAWVEDRVGQVASASLPIYVAAPADVDLRVQSIEVTQGVQFSQLPYAAVANPTAPVRYNGVRLATSKTTVVRVYANAASTGRINHSTTGVRMTLRGSRDGRELAEGPLFPLSGTRALAAGAPVVSDAVRGADGGAYTFVLPTTWVRQGRLTLIAEVNPPEVSVSPGEVVECRTCRANNVMRLTDIPFEYWPPEPIHTVEQFYTRPMMPTVYASPVAAVFAKLRQVYPAAEFQYRIGDYEFRQDVSYEVSLGGDTRSRLSEALSGYELSRNPGGQLAGVSNGLDAGLAVPRLYCCTRFVQNAVVEGRQDGDNARPLTSVAHELFHVGLSLHASNCAPNNGAVQLYENWPPDERGLLQGYGLDYTFGSGTGGPFRVLGPSSYDFMSYCANSSPDNNSWISVRNWNRRLGGAQIQDSAVRARAAATTRAAPTTGTTLRASVVVNEDGSATLLSSSLRTGRAASADPSAFTLIARDAQGGAVGSGPMFAGRASEGGSTILTGELSVPAEVAAFDVLRNGGVIAQATRTAAAPVVKVLAPRAGARLTGGRDVDVRWSATDADGPSLTVRVEFSADGGSTWRMIGSAGPQGRLKLPGYLFRATRRGRVRVTADDGFNRTSAVSGLFTSAGTPPLVRILTPAGRPVLKADGVLSLAGEAYEARVQPLAAKRLRWFDGRRAIGSGATAQLNGLRAGSHRIRLVARDAAGRAGSDTLVVRVQAVRPLFLGLRVVSRGARVVRLRVASSVPAVLRAGGRSFAVARRARVLRVPTGGRTSLRLTLRAGKLATTQVVTVGAR